MLIACSILRQKLPCWLSCLISTRVLDVQNIQNFCVFNVSSCLLCHNRLTTITPELRFQAKADFAMKKTNIRRFSGDIMMTPTSCIEWLDEWYLLGVRIHAPVHLLTQNNQCLWRLACDLVSLIFSEWFVFRSTVFGGHKIINVRYR